MMENVTHSAVAQSAADNGLYPDDFWLNFSNVSGALSIEHSMCTWYRLHLTALKYIIQNEDAEINSAIEHNLDTPNPVTISLNKLRHFIGMVFMVYLWIYIVSLHHQADRCADVGADKGTIQ